MLMVVPHMHFGISAFRLDWGEPDVKSEDERQPGLEQEQRQDSRQEINSEANDRAKGVFVLNDSNEFFLA